VLTAAHRFILIHHKKKFSRPGQCLARASVAVKTRLRESDEVLSDFFTREQCRTECQRYGPGQERRRAVTAQVARV